MIYGIGFSVTVKNDVYTTQAYKYICRFHSRRVEIPVDRAWEIVEEKKYTNWGKGTWGPSS